MIAKIHKKVQKFVLYFTIYFYIRYLLTPNRVFFNEKVRKKGIQKGIFFSILFLPWEYIKLK
jgi:hypothetical protein